MNTARPLAVVSPITLTDAILSYSDVPEDDYPAWAIGTTYAVAARVIRSHKIWESLQAANLAKAPESEPLWWVEVSATNRWRAFDLSNSSQTAKASAITYEITPGQAVNAVAAINLANASSARFQLTDPSFGEVYDTTINLATIPDEASWYAWFFGARSETPQAIATDLPSYPNATLRIELVGGADLAVGVILFGQQKLVGTGVHKGATLGIQDYSRKEKNDFGDTVLIKRAFAKRASFSMLVKNTELDNTFQALTDLRASPALWIGSGTYASTQIFGFYKSFDLSISYADFTDCTLEIEGLT